MVISSRMGNSGDGLLATIEGCLNNYASDIYLAQSPLAGWEVVKSRLPAGVTLTPEQIALTVRAVLDNLIDALYPRETCDLNSHSARQYIIADNLYRRGLKQVEICRSHLPLSKSQFYRERAETLVALANCIQQWERQVIKERKLKVIKTLTMTSSGDHAQLIGVDSQVAELTEALTGAPKPKLIVLCGTAGHGKTAITQAAVKHILPMDQFHALAWVNVQSTRFTGAGIRPVDSYAHTPEVLMNHLICQLRPKSFSDDHLFNLMLSELQDGQVTLDEVLHFLHSKLDGHDPSHLPWSEKQSLLVELLWETPTLIVIDGLESKPYGQPFLEDFWHILAHTQATTIVTSRNQFADCHFAHRIHLLPLPKLEAIQLMQTYAAKRGIRAIINASLEDLENIATITSGNPLVIKWFVNHLASLPIAQLMSDLSQGTGLSSELYRFMYQHVWESLSEPARHILVTLTKLAPSKISWDVLQHTCGLQPPILGLGLNELVDSSLLPVSESFYPLYEISSLTRTFVSAATGSRSNGKLNHTDVLPANRPSLN